jgi:hypothetical protein
MAVVVAADWVVVSQWQWIGWQCGVGGSGLTVAVDGVGGSGLTVAVDGVGGSGLTVAVDGWQWQW